MGQDSIPVLMTLINVELVKHVQQDGLLKQIRLDVIKPNSLLRPLEQGVPLRKKITLQIKKEFLNVHLRKHAHQL